MRRAESPTATCSAMILPVTRASSRTRTAVPRRYAARRLSGGRQQAVHQARRGLVRAERWHDLSERWAACGRACPLAGRVPAALRAESDAVRRDAGGTGTKRPAATDDGRAEENRPRPATKKQNHGGKLEGMTRHQRKRLKKQQQREESQTCLKPPKL